MEHQPNGCIAEPYIYLLALKYFSVPFDKSGARRFAARFISLKDFFLFSFFYFLFFSFYFLYFCATTDESLRVFRRGCRAPALLPFGLPATPDLCLSIYPLSVRLSAHPPTPSRLFAFVSKTGRLPSRAFSRIKDSCFVFVLFLSPLADEEKDKKRPALGHCCCICRRQRWKR